MGGRGSTGILKIRKTRDLLDFFNTERWEKRIGHVLKRKDMQGRFGNKSIFSRNVVRMIVLEYLRLVNEDLIENNVEWRINKKIRISVCNLMERQERKSYNMILRGYYVRPFIYIGRKAMLRLKTIYILKFHRLGWKRILHKVKMGYRYEDVPTYNY